MLNIAKKAYTLFTVIVFSTQIYFECFYYFINRVLELA